MANGKSLQTWAGRILFLAAGLLLFLSMNQMYWCVVVRAPQYPGGLKLCAYVDRLTGDVRELDTLNHYIGMRPLEEAAHFERQIARKGVFLLIALCVLAAVTAARRITLLFILPVGLFPFIFAGDLYYWLRKFGLNLDPKAPLNHAVKPFVPPLFGHGRIAQFDALARFQTGFWMALGASALVFIGYWLVRVRRVRTRTQHVTEAQMVAAALLMGLVMVPVVHARTRVVNPGASTATIQNLLDHAAPGDTIVFEKGVYPGPFVVRRPIRLIGKSGAVIDGRGKGTVLTILAPNVVIRGLTVRNSGTILTAENTGILIRAPGVVVEKNRLEDVLFGIYLKNAGDARIVDNILIGKAVPVPRRGDLIRTWYSQNVLIERNQLRRGRDLVLWFSDNLHIRENRVSEGRYGIHFMYSDNARIERNLLTENSVGSYLMYSHRLHLSRNMIIRNRGPSGYGVGLKDMDETEVRNNFIAGNRVGIFLENSTGTIEGNTLAVNDTGMKVFPSARNNWIRGNQFIWNGTQVSVEGQGQIDQNHWQANFWSDYTGLDLNGDGYGDEPYAPLHILEYLTAKQPALKIFHETPAARALDFAYRLFPIYRPRPILRDPRPLIQPPRIALAGMIIRSHPIFRLPGLFLLIAGLGIVGTSRLWLGSLGSARADAEAEKSTGEAVVVENLSMRFGATEVLKGVTFSVKVGECVALWGPNGAGKTTLIRCLLGILPARGSVSILGHDLSRNGRKVRYFMGYVPQEVRFNPHLTVEETLSFYAHLRRAGIKDIRPYLARFNLENTRDQRIRELSGGQRQKLALAIALLGQPPVLLLDEPTSNLDPDMRREFLGILRRLKDEGITIVFCTHRGSEVIGLADRILLLRDGTIEAETDVRAPQKDSVIMSRVQVICCNPEAAKQLCQEGEKVGFNGYPDGNEVEWAVPLGAKLDLLAWLMTKKDKIMDIQTLESEW